MKKNKLLILSLTCFIGSYYPYLFDPENRTNFILVSGGGLLYLAIIFLAEFITRELSDFSLLHHIRHNNKSKLAYLFVGLIGGIILDGTAQWLNRLWYYPYWDNLFYALIFIAGFSAYFLCIIESYLLIKVIIDKLTPKVTYITKPYKFEKKLFTALLIISILCIMLGIIGSLSSYFVYGGYFFNINNIQTHPSNFISAIFIFLGAWLLGEYLAYIQNRSTLIRNILHHNFDSLLAIIIASILLLIVMETQNAPLGLWVYANWPLQDIKLFSIPVVAIFAWPLHYIGILTLYRAITGDQTKTIFNGDKIK